VVAGHEHMLARNDHGSNHEVSITLPPGSSLAVLNHAQGVSWSDAVARGCSGISPWTISLQRTSCALASRARQLSIFVRDYRRSVLYSSAHAAHDGLASRRKAEEVLRWRK
jgi:hypothetical protein